MISAVANPSDETATVCVCMRVCVCVSVFVCRYLIRECVVMEESSRGGLEGGKGRGGEPPPLTEALHNIP